MWIKICANTSLEDAQFAAASGADAVGFVFAASPRQVTLDQVRVIAPLLPSSLEKIGVFVDAGFDAIVHAVTVCALTGVQLHHTEDVTLASRLKQHFSSQPGAPVRILQVVHYGPDLAERVKALRSNPDVDAILVDSRTVKAVGGTGIVFDWEAAQDSFTAFPCPYGGGRWTECRKCNRSHRNPAPLGGRCRQRSRSLSRQERPGARTRLHRGSPGGVDAARQSRSLNRVGSARPIT